MALYEWDKFINTVLSHVKFKYDHREIETELLEHIEDIFEDLVSQGVEEDEAGKLAVEFMGNADEIGEGLNKEHGAVIGTIWRVLRALVLFMIIINIIPVLNIGIMFISTVFGTYRDWDGGEMVYKIKIEEKAKIDDTNILIEEIRYYDDKTMEVRYKVWDDIFSRSIGWSFGLSGGNFYEEDGNVYFNSSGGSSAGFVSKAQVFLENYPDDAKTLIIDYDYNGRKFRFDIPLDSGREDE